jgi:hypothetical protein
MKYQQTHTMKELKSGTGLLAYLPDIAGNRWMEIEVLTMVNLKLKSLLAP